MPSSNFLPLLVPLDIVPSSATLRPLVHVIAESIGAQAPLFTIIILPSFNVINPSFKDCVVAEESAAAGAGVVVAAVESVVDGFESLLQAKVKPAIAVKNKSFFMMWSFFCFKKSPNLRNLLHYDAQKSLNENSSPFHSYFSMSSCPF